MRAGRHETVHRFLADVTPQDLRALRHLMTCPLCLQLTRQLLFGIQPAGEETAARSRPAGSGGANDDSTA